MFEFIWGVLSGLFQVFLYGGFIILLLKVYEWYDERIVVKNVGGFLSKKPSVVFKVTIPSGVHMQLSHMENFFMDASEMNSPINSNDAYGSGRWFFNLSFDIIHQNGETSTYIRAEKGRSVSVVSHLKNYYPNIILEEVEDPFKNWPREWWNKDGAMGFKRYRGADIMPKKTDLFPLKSWRSFYSGDRLHHDPMSVLFSFFKTLPKECILVIQYVTRPYDFYAPREKWAKELDKLRFEFANNAFVEKKGSTIQAITDHENFILNSIQNKITKKHYRLKMRWLVLYNNKDVDDGEVNRAIKSYLLEYKTDMQVLGGVDETDTDKMYSGKKYGPLEATIGKWMDKIYFTASEKEYRMRRLYAAIINHDLDMGADTGKFFIDTESLASLIHFPENSPPTSLNPIYSNFQQRQNQYPDNQAVVIQQYQPAYYIADSSQNQPYGAQNKTNFSNSPGNYNYPQPRFTPPQSQQMPTTNQQPAYPTATEFKPSQQLPNPATPSANQRFTPPTDLPT